MNDQVVAVRDKSESLQEMLAALRTGNTPFDALAAMLDSLQVACKKLLLQARDQGTDIFDQQYQLIPNSNPPRYHTRYDRSEEHTSELQSLMRISYAVFCLKKKK